MHQPAATSGRGRAQETYGEDPVHLGEFGAALVRGVQKHVMACAKHYALNSMENARFSVDVTIAPRPLHEIYLRHFKRAVEEGVASIMSAYNSVNGEWCGQNYVLLTEILKQQWNFQGFVMTDFIFGMRDFKKAALAGQDIEMPFEMIHRSILKAWWSAEKCRSSASMMRRCACCVSRSGLPRAATRVNIPWM